LWGAWRPRLCGRAAGLGRTRSAHRKKIENRRLWPKKSEFLSEIKFEI
jgi:hypothetical protein